GACMWPSSRTAARHPLLEVRQHSLRVGLALESHYEVVDISHDRDATVRMPAMPLVDPEVEDVMQEDVGEQRADARPLWGSPVRLISLIVLKDAGLEPHPD